MHAPIEVQVLIPQPFMGTIIGTGGMKIKELRKVLLLLDIVGLNFCSVVIALLCVGSCFSGLTVT